MKQNIKNIAVMSFAILFIFIFINMSCDCNDDDDDDDNDYYDYDDDDESNDPIVPTVYSSIALGTDGTVHVLFDVVIDEYTIKPYYAVCKNGIWEFDKILTEEMEEDVDRGHVQAIALDNQNKPHICFKYRSNAYYASKGSIGWDLINLEGKPKGKMDLVLDSSDYAHITYPEYEMNGLFYATNRSGKWELKQLPGSAGIVKSDNNSSIDLDSNDSVHISYGNGEDLCYFTNKSGNWETTTISKMAKNTDIMIDTEDIVYILFDKNDKLGYATNKIGTWEDESINAIREGLGRITLDSALDPSGNIYVFYQSYWSPYMIYIVTNASGKWDAAIPDPLIGDSFAMDIDAYGAFHLVAYGSPFNAFYAVNATGEWELEKLEPTK